MKEERWEHCRVNPYRGYAFFDGIFIEADSIYNPRWDRVIPVFEEEQVFVSRLMREKLSAGQRVLDLGSGSGVYSVVAAKAGCKVLAIDRTKRACVFTEDNVRQNQISSRRDFKDTKDGEVCVESYEVRPQTIDDFISRYGTFDIVILSPPYTPTYPLLKERLAVHAEAGQIGDEEFKRQIKIAPRLLNNKGICIGNQLSAITGVEPLPKGANTFAEFLACRESRERLMMIKDISAAFQDNFSLRFVPILPQLKSTQEFLREQYSDIAEEMIGLNQWIETISQEHPYLALLYYEICKDGEGTISLGVPPWGKSSEQPSHRRDWSYRASLHKAVVEHTSELGFTPLPLLVAEGATDGIISRQLDSPEIDHSLPPDDIYGVNLYSFIDKEIRSQQLEKWFSIIFMDTTPIVESEEGIRRLTNQNRVWIDGKANFSQNAEHESLAAAMLDTWLRTVTALQDARCGPFAHAAFVGLADNTFKWKWPEVVSTEFPLSDTQAQELHAAKQIVEQDFAPECDKIFAPGAEMPKTERFAPEFGFSQLSLRELKVSDFDSNEEQRLSRLRRLVPKLAEIGINKTLSGSARLDLKACQYVMHSTIHEKFQRIVGSSAGDLFPASTESLLFSMPLGMLFYNDGKSPTTAAKGFPPYYKGVFWALFVPKGRQQPVHEKAAQHLLRIAWLISNGAYGAKSEKSLIKYYSYEGKLSVTHQLTKDILALNNRIDIFNNDVAKKRLQNPGVEIPMFGRPDEFSFSVMQASALDKSRPLMELPEELAQKLAETWTTKVIDNLVRRLVEYPSKQRVKSHIDYYSSEPRRLQAYPPPKCVVPEEFKLKNSKGVFPLVILALRNAYQHAYLHTILNNSQQPGRIEIRHEVLDNGGEVITITNTGEPPTREQEARQVGWERDLRVFQGVTGKWRVEKNATHGQYSFYSRDEDLWLTRILFEG